MAFRAGYKFRVRLNSSTYVAADVGVDASVDPQDVSNTEGNTGNSTATAHVGYSAVIGGLSSARVNIRNATFDDSDNPFVAPLSVQAGNYATLRIYLYSTAGVSWYFPSFFFAGVGYNAQVRGLQPVNFNGQNDGLFYYPDGTG